MKGRIMRPCTFVHPETGQCPEKHYAKDYCKPHYESWKAYGDPSVARRYVRGTCTYVDPETGQCPKKHTAKGYCKKHYDAYNRHGDPSITDRITEGTLWERLEQRIEKVDHGFHQPCLEFTRTLVNGYGQMSYENKKYQTHIISYEHHQVPIHGPIPEGWEVDHMCCNKKCCNPDHLEALPPEVNKALGNIPHFKPQYLLVSGRLTTEEEDTANMRIQREHWKDLGVEVCQCCRGMGGILRL